ncbi:MAG: GNAT family N-acetyltransferase [Lysobacteraceae bacterium]|nr:MAG: GNAT family N-acetyltransferase [Xanthomonadaceae bacterium]
MDATVQVRDATREDIAFLVECNAAMARETERRDLDRALLAAGVAALFDAPARGFYLVATRGQAALGCLMVTREWSDWRNGDWWWLQSVHVRPDARRTGVFRALHAEVERRARAAQRVVGLRLYVERDNARAQATYAALGMHEAVYRVYERGFGEAADP